MVVLALLINQIQALKISISQKNFERFYYSLIFGIIRTSVELVF
jgi:hypothetical protein